MSEGARVHSIDAIKEFRVRMAKFGESAGLALGEADSDIGRTLTWLEGEQQTFWNGAIRKCQEILAKAEEAYRHKKLYKDATGSTPSALEELKAVNIAKKNLAHAIEKLANTKGWVRKLQKEALLYRGGVARFANAVSSGVPQAVGQLGGIIEMLEKYVDIGLEAPAGAGMESASTAGGIAGDGGMARPTDGVPVPIIELDGKMVRAMIPSQEVLTAAKRGPINLKSIFVPAEQHAGIDSLGTTPTLTTDDRVIVAPGTKEAGRIFVTRIPQETPAAVWYIGPVEATVPKDCTIIGAIDLLEGHADLRPLMTLAAGFIAVLDFSGASVVYDDKDAEVWKPPAPVAEAGQEMKA